MLHLEDDNRGDVRFEEELQEEMDGLLHEGQKHLGETVLPAVQDAVFVGLPKLLAEKRVVACETETVRQVEKLELLDLEEKEQDFLPMNLKGVTSRPLFHH